MKKVLKKIALALSIVMLLTSAMQSTFCFVTTKTGSLINRFLPLKTETNNVCISKIVEHPFGNDYVIPDNIKFDFKITIDSNLYKNSKIETNLGEFTTDDNGSFTASIKPDSYLEIINIDEGIKIKAEEILSEGSPFAIKGERLKEAITKANEQTNIEFINTYSPKSIKAEKVKLYIEKILEGRDWQSGDKFSFVLEQKFDEWNELKTAEIKFEEDNDNFNKLDLTSVIKDIEFTNIGSYKFRVKESKGNIEDINYDETVNEFIIKISDKDMDGFLEIKDVTGENNAVVTKNGEEYNVNVKLTNKYPADSPDVPPGPIDPEIDDITIPIKVQKTVVNKGPGMKGIGPQGFKFILKGDKKSESLLTNPKGKATFYLTFKKADIGETFNYTLYEKNEGKKGVTYDKTKYKIEITITEKDGNLVPKITVNNKGTKKVVGEFKNKYYSDKSGSPETRDETKLAFWIIMVIISGGMFAFFCYLNREKYVPKH